MKFMMIVKAAKDPEGRALRTVLSEPAVEHHRRVGEQLAQSRKK